MSLSGSIRRFSATLFPASFEVSSQCCPGGAKVSLGLLAGPRARAYPAQAIMRDLNGRFDLVACGIDGLTSDRYRPQRSKDAHNMPSIMKDRVGQLELTFSEAPLCSVCANA